MKYFGFYDSKNELVISFVFTSLFKDKGFFYSQTQTDRSLFNVYYMK
jgi:hypothetical protein